MRSIFWLVLIASFVALVAAMSYKKNDQDVYEADLIPVSSTVIPLHELTVTSQANNTKLHPKMLSRQEIKKILKKHMLSEEDPHQLITAKKGRTTSRRKSRMAYVFKSVR
ncbi:uncharacterized protein LOC134835680 [Culicoides brevitarsis]|uniref:uncharacterized protein LOC134835680 n=1 Tax=Culicoides brevitarsis TaxID=469753 RepID=UPI00307B24B7